jgi:hypothetical protein
MVLFVAYLAFASFPPGPQPSSPGLDPSWVAGLNMAHAQRLVPGRDWVFTYGPLGYLTVPEPESGALTLGLLYRAGIWAVCSGLVLLLAVRSPSIPTGFWVTAVFGAVALIDPYMWIDRLELTLAAAALLPIWNRSPWRYFELSFLALVAAFALLVKFNIGAEALALLLAVYGITLWEDRKIWPAIHRQAWIPPAVLIVACAGLYAVATGEIGSFRSYLYYGWQIATAYSESMTLIGPARQLHLAELAIALPVVVWLVGPTRRYLPGVLPAGVIVFFFFRHAFTRQHESRVISLLAQLAIALLFAVTYSRTRRERTVLGLLQVAVLLMSLQMSFAYDPHVWQNFARRLDLRSSLELLSTYFYPERTKAVLANAGDANLAFLRLDPSFHQEIGARTVEAAPWDIVSIRANGWNWRPRPVFQTYQACGPLLDLLNAEHLESPRAADFILLNWGEIDGRHQFLSDPRSWRAMLEWYDLALASGDHLLMRRRSTPRPGSPRDLGYTAARWNQETVIPQDRQILLMSVAIRRSFGGVFSGLFFGNAPVYATITYGSGQKERWRAVAPNLETGFPISPFPRNLADLASIWQSKDLPDRAASIRFESDSVSQYGDTLRVHWLQLPPAR